MKLIKRIFIDLFAYEVLRIEGDMTARHISFIIFFDNYLICMLTSYSFRDSDRLHVGFDVTDETNKDYIFEDKSFSQH